MEKIIKWLKCLFNNHSLYRYLETELFYNYLGIEYCKNCNYTRMFHEGKWKKIKRNTLLERNINAQINTTKEPKPE